MAVRGRAGGGPCLRYGAIQVDAPNGWARGNSLPRKQPPLVLALVPKLAEQVIAAGWAVLMSIAAFNKVCVLRRL